MMQRSCGTHLCGSVDPSTPVYVHHWTGLQLAFREKDFPECPKKNLADECVDDGRQQQERLMVLFGQKIMDSEMKLNSFSRSYLKNGQQCCDNQVFPKVLAQENCEAKHKVCYMLIPSTAKALMSKLWIRQMFLTHLNELSSGMYIGNISQGGHISTFRVIKRQV